MYKFGLVGAIIVAGIVAMQAITALNTGRISVPLLAQVKEFEERFRGGEYSREEQPGVFWFLWLGHVASAAAFVGGAWWAYVTHGPV